MKRIYILLLTCLSGLICFAQSPTNDALYIYRNDGKFNAFYYSEIDSITTCKLDEFGNEYDEYKSQIVWTQDSAYWIPLEVIDSVSLCKPINKYAYGVRKIDELLPYITDIDGMTLNLSPMTPSSLIPHKGEVLLYESIEDERFPYGFAGRVDVVDEQKIVCDSVNFDDIYEEFTSFGEYMVINEENSNGDYQKRFVPKRLGTTISHSIDISGTLRNYTDTTSAGFFVTAKGRMAFDMRFVYRQSKGKQPYINVTCHPHAKFEIESGVRGELSNKESYREVFMIPIPIPDTPFMVAITGGPVAKASLEASLTATWEVGELGFDFGFWYENGELHGTGHNTSKLFSLPQITGNIKGSLYAGIRLNVGLYSFSKLAGIAFYNDGGVEVVANMSEDVLNSNKYEELEKVTVDFNFKASTGTKAELKLGKYFTLAKDFKFGSVNINIASRKIVPSFSAPSIDLLGISNVITSVVPREYLLWPIPIGLGICNSGGDLLQMQYCAESFSSPDTWPLSKYQIAFESLVPGSEHEAIPMIKFLGRDIKASPSTPFVTKFPTPAKVKNFKVNNASFVRDGFVYKDKTYYYNFAATTTVELEDSNGIEDWGYVYKDPDGEKVHISVKDWGTNADSRYNYYRAIPQSTATLYGYAKYGNNKYAYEEPKEYDLVYTFHPTAYVGDVIADSITATSAQFEYGFNDVPRTGKCFVAVQAVGEDEVKIQSVPYAEKDTVKVSDLHPCTTYAYWAYVEYAGETYTDIDGKKTFTTLSPKATTGESSNITYNSAIVSCTFSDVPEGATCGVEYTWNDGSVSKSVAITNGTVAISLSGLKSSTEYTYCAYIELDGKTFYGEGKTFTTLAEIPDLSGIWTCTTYKDDGSVLETSTMTLSSDGKVTSKTVSGSSFIPETETGSWSINKEGKVGIVFSWTGGSSYHPVWFSAQFSGYVSSLSSPSSIEGTVYRAWAGTVNEHGDTYKFIMTR